MCGRVIQSSGPLRYAIVDGMNVRDSRVNNYPARWNAAPSQELLVIRRNHQTGEVSLDPLRWASFRIGAKTRKADVSRSTPNVKRCTNCPCSGKRIVGGAVSYQWTVST